MERKWLPHLYSADGVFVASTNTNLYSLKILMRQPRIIILVKQNFENGKSTSASAKRPLKSLSLMKIFTHSRQLNQQNLAYYSKK